MLAKPKLNIKRKRASYKKWMTRNCWALWFQNTQTLKLLKFTEGKSKAWKKNKEEKKTSFRLLVKLESIVIVELKILWGQIQNKCFLFWKAFTWFCLHICKKENRFYFLAHLAKQLPNQLKFQIPQSILSLTWPKSKV